MGGTRWNHKVLNISLLLDQLVMITLQSKDHRSPRFDVFTACQPSSFQLPEGRQIQLGSWKVRLIESHPCKLILFRPSLRNEEMEFLICC